MIEKVTISAKVFEDIWGLKNVKIKKILQQSNDRIVGIIQSKTGKYVFKTAGSWKNLRGVIKDTKIFRILRKKGFQYLPVLIETNKGENFVKFGKKYLYLLEYIEGKNAKPTAQTYKKLAAITAELHKVKNFPFKTDFDPTKIIKNLCKKTFSFSAEYRQIARTLPNFKTMPQTVIHTDIAPLNSIQKRNGKIILVDWDDAGIGPTALDLGAVLNEIIKENTSFNRNNLQSFYRAYFRYRRISKKEKTAIFDGCLFFALMYIVHGDTIKRWKRILWMIRNRKKIEKLYS